MIQDRNTHLFCIRSLVIFLDRSPFSDKSNETNFWGKMVFFSRLRWETYGDNGMMNQIMQNSVCQQLERNLKSLVRVRASEMGYASFVRWFIGVDKRQSLKWSISVSADRIFTDDIFSSMNALCGRVGWCCWNSHRLFPQVSQSLPGFGVVEQRSCESAATWRRWLELVMLCTHSHCCWPG